MQTHLLSPRRIVALLAALWSFSALPTAHGQAWVYLSEVPDYEWWAGCFGTASGNIAGYWDRHGFPDLYIGPTGGGLAPLNSFGGNVGIRSLWVSQSNSDGRPSNQPGHMDDYWVSYENPGQDPYKTAGRKEHKPDCIGDFIGLNQNKWTNLNNECHGNIDAFSFVFWDKTGNRRANFYTTNDGTYVPDIGSGMKEWARSRGYDADVFTQLTSFNGERTTTNGFTFEDVKAEINAGYPVLLFLQPNAEFSRTIGGVPNVNPEIHGILAYGYVENVPELGARQAVIVRTSWASGDGIFEEWALHTWLNLFYSSTFAPRGVIGFHPKPKIRSISRGPGTVTLTWDGPSAQLYDALAHTTTNVHHYAVQRATQLNPPNWKDFGTTDSTRSVTLPDTTNTATFYRVVLVP
jgi:hypothetical protein